MKTGVVIGLIAIVILAVVAGIFYFNPSSNSNPPSDNAGAGSLAGASNPNQSDTQTPQTYNISITGFSFSPQTLTIKAGDKVVWTNMDPTSHTVISDTGVELSSGSLSNKEIYIHVFQNPGTYSYHCSIHSGMTGKIIVK